MYNNPLFQPSFSQQQQVQSQYRGFQQKFQPTGYVQSFYQQQAPTMMNPQAQTQTQNYHLSNYVGNRQNHDASLRADSTKPSNYAMAATQQNFAPISSMQGMSGFNTAATATQMSGGYQNPNSYHTANYVGNQPNHDSYLRADSTSPSNWAMQQTSFKPSVSSNQFIQQQGQGFSPYRGF